MWTDLSEWICKCVFILVSLTPFDCVWANTCPLGDAKVNSWLRCLPLSPSQFSFSHWLIFLFFVALSRLLVHDRLCLLSSMYHSSAAPTSTPYITNTGVQLLWCYSAAFVRLQRTWLNPPCDGRQIGDFLKCSHWNGKKKKSLGSAGRSISVVVNLSFYLAWYCLHSKKIFFKKMVCQASFFFIWQGNIQQIESIQSSVMKRYLWHGL